MDSDLEIVAHPDTTAGSDAGPGDAGTAVVPPKRRAPRKPSKPDSVLAAAVEFARNGVLQVAEPGQVGDHVGAYPDAERVVTHRFVAHLPGYGGWHWFATLARVPRGKEPTLSEVGLLPSETSLLSPPWVPWAERVRPEDSATDDDAGVESAEGSSTATGSRHDSAEEESATGDTRSSDAAPGGE
ncbi:MULTISPECIES: DUF3027 domain-containing protein [unclassified Arthrobacter]|uniref:DUF3027 domain-containing protein n=1 Tax=unclassified Arthrobacter TaxID=235627 RepID=UPI00149272F2|nr:MULTISPECIES: DUF3027 domain-containing protein [unclassified Arthrobacter]MBE0010509.1 DUF3027 domain-containing protein [Arthrobacter sp. AET 35A]NOJ64318.1 DUF3027 domain-containing protein [Arthrobacter sp. 147(2020)]